MITRNPWRSDVAQVVLTGEDGHETFFLVEEVRKNEFGFAEGAAVFGESYKALPETPAQMAAKETEALVTGTDNAADAAAARKAKALPFGGRLDPYKHIDDTTLPAYMPKRGQASDVRGPRTEQRPMTHVEAAKALRDKFSADGLTWTPEHYRQLTAQYPDGVPEAALDEVMATLTTPPAAVLSALLTATEEGNMLVLKQQLKEARIPQAVVARAVDVSEATLAQIVNHNAWPRTSPGEVRRRLASWLESQGIDTTKSFDAVQGAATPRTAGTTDKTSLSEEENMLLKKQVLFPATKKRLVFSVTRSPTKPCRVLMMCSPPRTFATCVRRCTRQPVMVGLWPSSVSPVRVNPRCAAT